MGQGHRRSPQWIYHRDIDNLSASNRRPGRECGFRITKKVDIHGGFTYDITVSEGGAFVAVEVLASSSL